MGFFAINENDIFSNYFGIQYAVSFAIAMTLLLLIESIYIIVLTHFHPSNKFNRLTFTPYYALIGFCVFVIIQLAFSIVYEPS